MSFSPIFNLVSNPIIRSTLVISAGIVAFICQPSVAQIQPQNALTINVPANPWPMELGNSWEYEVHLPAEDLDTWREHYKWMSGEHRIYNCDEADFSGINLSKTRLTVKPTDGLNRYFTTRYVLFEKEKRGAYHGPRYCARVGENPNVPHNSWNLRWYMHNPITKRDPVRGIDFTWLGSEGGIRWQRAEADTYGYYPAELGYLNGAGRTPIEAGDELMRGLPGYTYLPIRNAPVRQNSIHTVVPDVTHTGKMGIGFGSSAEMITNLINKERLDAEGNPISRPLRWDLEFVKTKAKHVTKNGVAGVPDETDVLGVLFFENYDAHDPSARYEKACEAYYFADNIGLLRLDVSWVAFEPGKDNIEDKKQLCFSLFKLYDNGSEVQAIPDVEFDVDDDCGELQRPCFKQHAPMNTMELVSFDLKHNANSDSMGFHSPDAASLIFISDPVNKKTPLRLYVSNGRYWYYKPDGTIYREGSIFEAWNGKAQPVDGVYPWTGNGPDAIEYEGAIPIMAHESSAKGIVINNMKYWLHDYTASPLAKFPVSGRVPELFEQYPWANTERLGMTTNGADMILLTKDGYYVYYKRKSGTPTRFEKVTAFACSRGNGCPPPQGLLQDLPGWQQAPAVGGHQHPYDRVDPLSNPDALMYGQILPSADSVAPATQFLTFTKGAAWLRGGFSGPWESWELLPGELH